MEELKCCFLQWEQKWLAQQVKWDFTADEREELFLTWNIHKESKQRKLQLIKCLWSAKTLRCLSMRSALGDKVGSNLAYAALGQRYQTAHPKGCVVDLSLSLAVRTSL